MRARVRTLSKALRPFSVPVPALLVTALLLVAAADDAFA